MKKNHASVFYFYFIEFLRIKKNAKSIRLV